MRRLPAATLIRMASSDPRSENRVARNVLAPSDRVGPRSTVRSEASANTVAEVLPPIWPTDVNTNALLAELLSGDELEHAVDVVDAAEIQYGRNGGRPPLDLTPQLKRVEDDESWVTVVFFAFPRAWINWATKPRRLDMGPVQMGSALLDALHRELPATDAATLEQRRFDASRATDLPQNAATNRLDAATKLAWRGYGTYRRGVPAA